MTHLTNSTKILKFLEKTILGKLEDLYKYLFAGQMSKFESLLSELLQSSFNHISDILLPDTALQLEEALTKQGRVLGGRKIEMRPLKISLSTGHQVQVMSPYVKQLPKDKPWQGSRHMVARHWHLIGGASPGLYSRTGYCSALGPSYDLASQTLGVFGINKPISAVRDLTNHLADYCYDYGEEKLMLGAAETLAGKRVVISVDGGRTRLRQYSGKYNENGQPKYDTSWSEPKLFVIEVLDQQGKPNRLELPIYGCRFDEQDMLHLLEAYLKELQIEQAEQVQILADGAPWIWNRIKPMLLRIGLPDQRIVETLDYYHAVKYVHDLVEQMPKRVGKQARKDYLNLFKYWLWQGTSDLIVAKCRQIIKRLGKTARSAINYLTKHQCRTQYIDYQNAKLMCGSGVIESGIRRVINLRFKNASTFWNKSTVEKLYALRIAMLSNRWRILMDNIENST